MFGHVSIPYQSHEKIWVFFTIFRYTCSQCITLFLKCIRHLSNVLQFIRQSEHQCHVIPVKPVNILCPVNNLEPIAILEPGGRRRPDLYANIPVPVLQVPAGEEGEPGGFAN